MDAETEKKNIYEFRILKKWIEGLVLPGIVVDLGSGTGQWTSIWAKQALRVICVDASAKMLKISQRNNNFSNVEHIQRNLFDTEWIRDFLRKLGKIDVIVLGFVLNLFTLEQEEQLLTTLRSIISSETRLILLESQSSVFSSMGYFSRTEIQYRTSPFSNQKFEIYKRNFLPFDARRVLSCFGNIEQLFYTDNYFVAGVAYF